MCGISAVLDRRPGADPALALRRMHGELRHRGPDGEGHLWIGTDGSARVLRGTTCDMPASWDGTGFAASFRWLQVQDREPHANQPMASADGRAWLLFNGEIYNHAELRRELEASGASFRTHSDTEVLLAAYRQWGTACFPRLRGMWGLVLVDLERRCVVVSRDRLGIKPLFYAREGSRLLLASEARAIVAAQREGPRVELFRAHEYLRGLPPQSADLSFFRDVLPVPAGCYAELPLADDAAPVLRFVPYWDLASIRAEDLPESRFAACREAFEALLRDAANEHAAAAVPVGTLLSGGLDTSILARLLAERAARLGAPPPEAYSIIYADPAMSEWPYMQFVVAQGGLRGAKHVLTPEQAWDASAAVVEAQGQPLLGQDIIAQYHAFGLARAHGSVVVWDGQGADELLAGLPLYESQWLLEQLRSGRWRRFAREMQLRKQRYGLGWRATASGYLGAPLRRRWNEHRGLPHPAWLRRDVVDSSRFGLGRTADWGPETSLLARFLYRHVRHTNLPQMLLMQDHGSMAHGVEGRVPFLDHRLVEFAFRLPDTFKLKDGVRKRILLETARGIVPPQVANRRDKRMFVSKPAWMELRKRRAAELRESAASPELRDFALIHPGGAENYIRQFLAGGHDDEMGVWRLHSLGQWLRRFRASC
jgi:asparagine synthase (glutamine-hydrolysing)